MCQVHTGARVSLLTPGETKYSDCHPRKTTAYILHVVSITPHTHDRNKSIGEKETKKRKEDKGKERKEKKNETKRKREAMRRKRQEKQEKTRQESKESVITGHDAKMLSCRTAFDSMIRYVKKLAAAVFFNNNVKEKTKCCLVVWYGVK